MVPSRMGISSTLVNVIKGLPHPQACSEASCPRGDSRLCQVYRTVATILAVIWTGVRLSQENWGSGSGCSPRPIIGSLKTLGFSKSWVWYTPVISALRRWSVRITHEFKASLVSVSLVYRVPDQAGLHSKVLPISTRRIKMWCKKLVGSPQPSYIDFVDVFITYLCMSKRRGWGRSLRIHIHK